MTLSSLALGYYSAMLDDSDARAALDPPDPDRVYRNYLETCRRLGVEPVLLIVRRT